MSQLKPRIQQSLHLTRPSISIIRLHIFQQSHFIHSSQTSNATTTAPPAASVTETAIKPTNSPSAPSASSQSHLAVLPLSQVLRTLLITAVSSYPPLLDASASILRRLINSPSKFVDVEHNRVLKALLRSTFYDHFCAGETKEEVQQAVQQLRSLGYEGVILEYALEVLKGQKIVSDAVAARDVEAWRSGLLETLRMAEEGDFVGLKWSGLGIRALQLLKKNEPPSDSMHNAMTDVCDLAAKKSVSLLPAAEEVVTSAGYYNWTLMMQRAYNTKPGRAIVYSTYQAYLKQTPKNLTRHLALARTEGFTLGVKLVRGAYLASETRSLIHDTKEQTDAAYDGIVEALLQKEYGGLLNPVHGVGSEQWPEISVMLATHNLASVKKAMEIRKEQAEAGVRRVDLAYAQLQGMADEVSCALIKAGKEAKASAETVGNGIDVPKVYKCTTWGSVGECLNYLLRRAAENKDAATRTKDTRNAMAGELMRRAKASVGLV